MHQDQTIIAQCTPQGSGAIALLRMSGKDALLIASHMSSLAGKASIADVPTHTIHMGHVNDVHGQAIDQVMFFVMHAPRTFTGEDVVEITTHNNPFIIEAVIQQAIYHGARLAQEGEFCRRAVLNGKMDLVQAEAINELIHANTHYALKQSLAQVQGSFSHFIHELEQDLIKAIAFCMASFEFIDEENMTFAQDIAAILQKTLTTITTLKSAFDQQQRIRDGIRIALIGSVNAGKSSLFNALLQIDRAIVTDIAGTTRDVIEAGIYAKQTYWTLVDTAGLRVTNDTIEAAGIERSLKEAEQADVILLVIDQSRQMCAQAEAIYADIAESHTNKIIRIHSKADMPSVLRSVHDALPVSSTTGHGVPAVRAAIEQKAMALMNTMQAPYLINKRQFALLLSLETNIKDILPLLNGTVAYELLMVHLQEAVACLSELTGKTVTEAGMDKVFREFCVGK